MDALIREHLKGKGQYARLEMRRFLKVQKEILDTVTKRAVATVRRGLAYDAQAKVQAARASGELPAVNVGLPWGRWEIFPHVIRHKGELYLRFYPTEQIQTEYFVNGKLATPEIARALCLPSEFRDRDSPPYCFTVKRSNIISLNGIAD